jgi:hypothetical protein
MDVREPAYLQNARTGERANGPGPNGAKLRAVSGGRTGPFLDAGRRPQQGDFAQLTHLVEPVFESTVMGDGLRKSFGLRGRESSRQGQVRILDPTRKGNLVRGKKASWQPCPEPSHESVPAAARARWRVWLALFHSGPVLNAEDLDGSLALVNSVVNQVISVDEFQDAAALFYLESALHPFSGWLSWSLPRRGG